jgi:cell division septal protein FtsQ
LLDKNKNLSSLGFKKQWPSTLRVYIEERRPLVQVFHEKELWLMDRAGVLFVSSQKALPIFWPLPEDKTMLLNILTWLEKDNSDFNGLSWDNDLGLLVIGKNKERIILGRQNFAVNWKKAQDSMKYLEKQQRFAKTIDATYNNRAVVSF